MKKTAVLIVVGLTPEILDGPGMPSLTEWSRSKRVSTILPVLPAVTCTAQATYYTGVATAQHGIVANGWYFRNDCEVHFWRQSNKLVEAPKIWDLARQIDPSFTCANLFGWYNMYSSVDVSITPRPMYPADGRKIPDIHTFPGNLREEVQKALGTFPLFEFWGPRTSIRSTQWIAEAAKFTEQRHRPTLTFVYLPHLDYNLQKLGPGNALIAADLHQLDNVLADLIRFYESRETDVVILSEYGISPVDTPVHVNREFRRLGLLTVREELGLEVLDPGASAAFAVADHQIAHIYVNDPSKLSAVRSALERLEGVDLVLDEEGKRRHGLHHPRSGEFVVIARPNAWFTYYYWLDDRKAPDFARTVDIHRKPGYDPVELFVDPQIRFPMLTVGQKLLKRKMGFRSLLDIIPLDASLVKGSHGRADVPLAARPVFIGRSEQNELPSTAVCAELLRHLG